MDILVFIKFYEVIYFDQAEQDSVIYFLKKAAEYLDFNTAIVDDAVVDMLNDDFV